MSVTPLEKGDKVGDVVDGSYTFIFLLGWFLGVLAGGCFWSSRKNKETLSMKYDEIK